MGDKVAMTGIKAGENGRGAEVILAMEAFAGVAKKPDVQLRLERLADLERSELVTLWVKQFKSQPPKGVKRGLLERAAGHQLQAKHSGRLNAATRRALLAIAAEQNSDYSKLTSGHLNTKPLYNFKSTLQPGSKIIREWHGKKYVVNVSEKHFEWEGREYKSLSAIACAITGTKWSGPRFFGVKS